MHHEFHRSLAIGKEGEEQVDAIMGKWWHIKKVLLPADKAGTDRVLTLKKCSECTMRAQYKMDDAATTYGNLFIEFVSVDNTNAPGWAVKCDADWLCVWLPRENILYVLCVAMLKIWAPAWASVMKADWKTIPNAGYNTLGVAVNREKIIDKSPVLIKKLHVKGTTGLQSEIDWATA